MKYPLLNKIYITYELFIWIFILSFLSYIFLKYINVFHISITMPLVLLISTILTLNLYSFVHCTLNYGYSFFRKTGLSKRYRFSMLNDLFFCLSASIFINIISWNYEYNEDNLIIKGTLTIYLLIISFFFTLIQSNKININSTQGEGNEST